MYILNTPTSSGIMTFEMDENDKDRYLVLTCAKKEDNYLIEFVEHYLNLGFDKIIIADNNNEPTILTVLDKYIKENKVQVLDFRGISSFQVQLYSAFANLGVYKWCAYFDADEFLEINAYLDIKSFLNEIEENAVLFQWINFGSNGEVHYNNKPLKERFPKPISPILYFKENCFLKSILRGGDYWKGSNFNGSHIPYFDETNKHKNIYNLGGYNKLLPEEGSHLHCRYPLCYKYGYLKHYYTKSFDEWITKSSRGWPDGTVSLNTATFFGYNKKETFDFDKFIYCAFGSNSDFYNDITKHSEFYNEILSKYSVIEFKNDSYLIYSLIITLVACMKATTDHTFILTDKHIDNILFGILLECAFHTGNRIVYCPTHTHVWNTYLKHHKNNEQTYYIITVN